jgi:hypothetical protein
VTNGVQAWSRRVKVRVVVRAKIGFERIIYIVAYLGERLE